MEIRPNITNIIDFRRTSAKARQTIKKAKKNSWRKFCQNLSADTPTKIVWNMLRKLNGKGTSSDIPLKMFDRPIHDDKIKAEILSRNLWNIIGREPGRISPDKESTLQDARDSPDEDGYNSRFSSRNSKIS